MPPLYRAALILHVAAAFVGLVAFWIPIFARKGGRVHVRAGWDFAVTLLIVSLTALALSAWTLADPLGTRPLAGVANVDAYARGRRITGVLLAYLAVLTFAFGWHGIQNVRRRGDLTRMRTPFDVGLNVLLTLCGAAAVIVGLLTGAGILVGMSALGLIFGPAHLYQIFRLPAHRMGWFFRHFGAMLGGGIAFHTAFLVFGAGRIIPGYSPGLWMWFLPAIVGGAGIAFTTARYRRKFADPTR